MGSLEGSEHRALNQSISGGHPTQHPSGTIIEREIVQNAFELTEMVS